MLVTYQTKDSEDRNVIMKKKNREWKISELILI